MSLIEKELEIILDGIFSDYEENKFIVYNKSQPGMPAIDITDYVTNGTAEITVLAKDSLSPKYPYGKQKEKRGGMWYTPVSGIWQ